MSKNEISLFIFHSTWIYVIVFISNVFTGGTLFLKISIIYLKNLQISKEHPASLVGRFILVFPYWKCNFLWPLMSVYWTVCQNKRGKLHLYAPIGALVKHVHILNKLKIKWLNNLSIFSYFEFYFTCTFWSDKGKDERRDRRQLEAKIQSK